MALSENYAKMQEVLDKPSCFGKYQENKKCGMCWFWNICKDKKETKKATPKKKESTDK